MVFALHSKVVQNLAAVVEFVHAIIKTLNCCAQDKQVFIIVYKCPSKTQCAVYGNRLIIIGLL